jgi:hypothetical protein
MQTAPDFDARIRWVLPSGNLGDALVLSGVLRNGLEARGERFGIVRVPPFTSFFMRHPAVAQIATPPDPAQPVLRTDHWAVEVPPAVASRPFTRLSHMIFGCVMGEDRPWADVTSDDRAALSGLPLSRAPVLLCPGADPTDDGWPLDRWADLAERLRASTAAPIVLAGHIRQARIPGTTNVSGLLSPRQVLALVERAQACIGVDPFISVAGRMFGAPALSLYDVAGVPSDIRRDLARREAAGGAAPRLSALSVEEVFTRARDEILGSVDEGRPFAA